MGEAKAGYEAEGGVDEVLSISGNFQLQAESDGGLALLGEVWASVNIFQEESGELVYWLNIDTDDFYKIVREQA